MKINRKKSGVIFHMKRSKTVKENEEFCRYPVKENYKYLGIYLDQTMKMNYQLD